MALLKVYQYDYFDRLLKRDRRSQDYATGDAIAAMGGTIIAESVRVVDEGLLDARGFIKAADLPPRVPDTDSERLRHWMRPDDTRTPRA